MIVATNNDVQVEEDGDLDERREDIEDLPEGFGFRIVSRIGKLVDEDHDDDHEDEGSHIDEQELVTAFHRNILIVN